MNARGECWDVFKMAVALRRVFSSFGRSEPAFRRYRLSKCFASDIASKDEGILKRIKKFVVGEKIPTELSEHPSERYYELSERQEPSIHSMDAEEISAKIEHITKELFTSDDEWKHADISNIMTKYKVLSKCYNEFGVMVPNYRLDHMNNVDDLINFYTSSLKPVESTFQSIDLDNLPPNLQIGGKLPRKQL